MVLRPNAQAEAQGVSALMDIPQRPRAVRRSRGVLQRYVESRAIARELRAKATRERELADFASRGEERKCPIPRAKADEDGSLENLGTECLDATAHIPRVNGSRFVGAKPIQRRPQVAPNLCRYGCARDSAI